MIWLEVNSEKYILVNDILVTGLLSDLYISEITTSIIFSFEPLFAAITAYFYLNEAITERTVIGGLMIFTGILFAEIKMKGIFRSIKRRYSLLKR